jgi:hypothetical protein
MGIIDEDGDIKQPLPIWDLGVVAIAAVFTAFIVGLWFFKFTVPADKPVKPPAEVTIGIGQGSTIHPVPQSGAVPAAKPDVPAHP